MAESYAVKVTGISPKATEKDLREFFSFSGEIKSLELKKEAEAGSSDGAESQAAYVCFTTIDGLNTALLLSDAVIIDQQVKIVAAPEDYVPPQPTIATAAKVPHIQRAADVVSSLLAHGYIMGKGALEKAKTYDEKHQLSAKATEKAQGLNEKFGFTAKLASAAGAVNAHVKAVDEKYAVTEKTKSALQVAEQKVNDAATVIAANKHVQAGHAWVSSTVAKAYEKVAAKTGTTSTATPEAAAAGVEALSVKEPGAAPPAAAEEQGSTPAVLTPTSS